MPLAEGGSGTGKGDYRLKGPTQRAAHCVKCTQWAEGFTGNGNALQGDALVRPGGGLRAKHPKGWCAKGCVHPPTVGSVTQRVRLAKLSRPVHSEAEISVLRFHKASMLRWA